MQIALVNDERVESFSGGRGVCPVCGSEMIAKCGPRVMHHWAHHRPKDCDPWWENETKWHRDWKNLFPLECREVSHTPCVRIVVTRLNIMLNGLCSIEHFF